MKIDYSCPRCGAPIVLDETDRLLTCPYCRVRHYLVPEDCFHYYLPPHPSIASERILFVPYGRLRGMFFDLHWPDIESKVIDTNFLLAPGCGFPGSLGLRPQTLHLRPALFHREERCLAPAAEPVPFPTSPVLAGSPALSASATSTREIKAWIGEVKSLIYAPFYRQPPHWFDGVLNQPVSTSEGAPRYPEPAGAASQAWKISFLPVLCPACGWDLEAENESCLLFCPQCAAAWEPKRMGFKKIDYEVLGVRGISTGFFYLPFWRITPLPGTPTDRIMEEGNRPRNRAGRYGRATCGPDRISWLPAFKIAPRLFLLLAKRMSQAPNPGLALELPGLPDSFHPVTLPAAEAREGLPLIWSILAGDPEAIPDLTPASLAEECRTDLVFIPFIWTPLELVQPQVNIGVSRSALNLAKYI